MTDHWLDPIGPPPPEHWWEFVRRMYRSQPLRRRHLILAGLYVFAVLAGISAGTLLADALGL